VGTRETTKIEVTSHFGFNLIQPTDGFGKMTAKRIISNPKVMMGKPVFEGTRIPVEIILRKLGHGDSVGQLLRDYPSLTADDLHTAQRYAADVLANETFIAAE
jgi:uncharacterized protein (DUF433 family)